MKDIAPLRIETRRVADLRPYAENSRTHSEAQIRQIAASIQQFGWTNPILIGPDNVIIAGHARWLAAQRLQLVEVPVIVLSQLTPIQRKALVVADNRLALNAGWDLETLRLELDELRAGDFDLDLLGFDTQELEKLWAEIDDHTRELSEPESALVPSPHAVTALGEMWRLGGHRLLCGTAVNRSDVERLMLADQADLLFTEVPDAVEAQKQPDDGTRGSSKGMRSRGWRAFLDAALAGGRGGLKPTASLYICHSWRWQRHLEQALAAAGFEIHSQIVWAKSHAAGSERYRARHKLAFYAHAKGYNDPWFGDGSQSSLWQEDPSVVGFDPMANAVDVIEHAIQNSSRKGNLVVDWFGGSGCTLMACERAGRRARLLEADPLRCDTIIRRWQEFTRKEAVLEDSSYSFDDVAAERSRVLAR
jgi:ParB-like chromosome segregation protein Spo0J